VLRSTAQKDTTGKALEFYDAVGATPYANDYQFDFVRELVKNEKLGAGETTDLLVVSLSSFDILAHKVGPESPEMAAMTVRLDQQLGDFFSFLNKQVGLQNVWIALSADHGAAPMPEYARALRLPAGRIDESTLAAKLNDELAKKFGKPGEYARYVGWPAIYLRDEPFTAAGISEAEAERAVGEAVVKLTGSRGYFTKSQLATSDVPNTQIGRRYEHSYSPLGGWYVLAVPQIFISPYLTHTNEHYSPYNYNGHVPLLLFGSPFKPGIYRTHAEPVDLASTLASLLGINKPTHSIGRVLTEAIVEQSAGAARAMSGPDAKGDKGPK
jgi:predicted AlkP superfamily pyrophosphatase or phosphodiesterase